MNNIAILVTTFCRNELAYNIINSIQPSLNENCLLLIGDQNKNKLSLNPNWHYTYHLHLPFDCGLSKSRNILVRRAYQLDCNYCLISADSIEFTDIYNFNPIIEFMENNNIGMVGFEIKNRIYWNCDIHKRGKKIILDAPKKEPIYYNNIKFQQCDMVRNFFLAKTSTLLDIAWDNDLKLAEHTEFFYRYSQKYKIYFTDYIQAKYIKHSNAEYSKYRQRISYFRRLYQDKYGIESFHNYTPELKKKFTNWRKNG